MRPAAIFSDHMVLQGGKKCFVFGESEVDEIIEVSIDNIKVKEKVTAGKWKIELPEHGYGGPYTFIIRSFSGDGESVSSEYLFEDVFYGEVWIVNGQSNIEFELQNADGGEKELAEASFSDIRYFKSIKTPVIDEAFLEEEKKLSWKRLENGNFRDISGVGYFFAKKLHEKLGVTVGMVDCYQGGTSVSCWLSKERLSSHPEGMLYLEEFEESVKDQTEDEYERLLREYNKMVETHLALAAKAKEQNPNITPEELSAQAGDYPWPPPMGLRSAFRPCGLFYTMIERITPFASKGIIYYQGEEDSPKSERYKVLLKELISEFKDVFLDKELPVVIIQLPMFISRNTEDFRDWALIREAQEEAVNESQDASLVSIIDCGEFDNVHPTDKKTPGERTAIRILADVYNSELGVKESAVTGVEKEADGYLISFSDTYGALTLGENILIDHRKEVEGLSENDASSHIFGLEILDGQGEWSVPEKAVIIGDKVKIFTEKKIDAIRYAYFNYGKVNLYNAKGMPVRQFEVKNL